MSCLVPGRVIVAPKNGSIDSLVGMLSESARTHLEVAYSIADVLDHYHLGEGVGDLQKRVGPLPFVLNVPEGEEIALATRFALASGVRCSFPDFLVRPTGATFDINTTAVEGALRLVNLDDPDQYDGRGTKIAILDTGVDVAELKVPAALHPQQYNAQMRQFGTEAVAPGDPVGHGTLVAYIINRIAPAAKLLSVKTMAASGTMGSVLAGLYLAEAMFQPDIFNLSFTIRCDEEQCPVCQNVLQGSINAAQMRVIFEGIAGSRVGSGAQSVFVAAAGNNSSRVGIPALFPRFIAVGAYDAERQCEAEYSRHTVVPAERYILAPGGSRDPADALGNPTALTWERGAAFFGTSFAAAFVTGTVARCLSISSASHSIGDRCQSVLNYLATSCDRSWSDYSPSRHGLGLLRWTSDAAAAILGRGQDERTTECCQLFILLDTTYSMHEYLANVADHVAKIPAAAGTGRVLRLVLYADHDDSYTVYPCRVSESSEEISEAIRATPCTDGHDVPEALEDALHLVATEIECMHLRNVEVVVFTDAGPHPPAKCPHGYDFAAELHRLSRMNVRVTFIGCAAEPDWLGIDVPDGVTGCYLADHEW